MPDTVPAVLVSASTQEKTMQVGAITVTNFSAYGKLVQSWAKGEKPVPTTLEELQEQCAEAHAGVSFAPGIRRVKVVETDEDTVVIRLPRVSALQAFDRFLDAGAPAKYPLPDFYLEKFGKDPVIDDVADFRDARIGEYSVNKCC
jgi:hypothetical protein